MQNPFCSYLVNPFCDPPAHSSPANRTMGMAPPIKSSLGLYAGIPFSPSSRNTLLLPQYWMFPLIGSISEPSHTQLITHPFNVHYNCYEVELMNNDIRMPLTWGGTRGETCLGNALWKRWNLSCISKKELDAFRSLCPEFPVSPRRMSILMPVE